MAGIYIHIPFCAQYCHYCDFYSSVNTRLVNSFLETLKREIEQKADYFTLENNISFSQLMIDKTRSTIIETIYFGGGTPSLLTLQSLEMILMRLRNTFKISENAEITIEVNPDDVSFEYFRSLSNLGINRISIGIQSFDEGDLKLMNRRHNVHQANVCIEDAVKAGIENISIDLIYGLPGMTMEKWKKNLTQAFSLPIKHLSAYHLSYEKGTVFHSWLKKGIVHEMPDDESWKQYMLLHEMAVIKDFEHYEISNLAKGRNYSRHNSSYWKGIPYLGLGPSAHSYNGCTRQWNIANLHQYIKSLRNNENYWEIETLTQENKANEYVMIGLRTMWGIDLEFYKANFGEERYNEFYNKLQKYLISGIAEKINANVVLTLKSWFVSDRIIADLISG